MNCERYEQMREAWLAGTLPEAESRELEAHAASCERCETWVIAVLPPLPVPPPVPVPAHLRARTITAALLNDRHRGFRRAVTIAALAASIAIVALMSTPRRKRASDLRGGASILLAADLAQHSFRALDDAQRELTAALESAPNDAELLARLASIRSQRDALSRLVHEAGS